MRHWDSILGAEADPKETADQVETSECPDDEMLLLDETLSAESKGEPEPAIDSVLVLPTVFNISVETVQVSGLNLGMISESVGATDAP